MRELRQRIVIAGILAAVMLGGATGCFELLFDEDAPETNALRLPESGFLEVSFTSGESAQVALVLKFDSASALDDARAQTDVVEQLAGDYLFEMSGSQFCGYQHGSDSVEGLTDDVREVVSGSPSVVFHESWSVRDMRLPEQGSYTIQLPDGSTCQFYVVLDPVGTCDFYRFWEPQRSTMDAVVVRTLERFTYDELYSGSPPVGDELAQALWNEFSYSFSLHIEIELLVR